MPRTENRRCCWHPWLWIALGVFLGGTAAQQVLAGSIEQRDYQVQVDGKDCGTSQITITRQDDGTTLMTGQASVRVTVVGITYLFSNQINEWWKDGRLIGMKASTNENRKRTELTVSSEANQLRLWVNGKERPIQPQTWTNSFWKLPDSKYHNQRIPILEVDAGKDHLGLLQYVGMEQAAIGSQQEQCYHFRVTGGPNPVDLWFDKYYLLIRQEFVEQGHRTVVQIKSVRR